MKSQNYRKIWEYYHGVKRRTGWHVHHKDGNKNNNHITNLVLISKRGHAKEHIRMGQPAAAVLIDKYCGADISGDNNPMRRPEVIAKRRLTPMSEDTKRKIRENHADVSGSKNPMFGRSREDLRSYNFNRRGKPHPHLRDTTRCWWVHPDHGEEISTTYDMRDKWGLCQSGLSMVVTGARSRSKGWRIKGIN